jgi:hypothetical protein
MTSPAGAGVFFLVTIKSTNMFYQPETGELVACPFCGEKEKECAHLIMQVDAFCGTEEGGYDYSLEPFSEVLQETMALVLDAGTPPPPHWSVDWELSQLWEHAQSSWQECHGEVYVHKYSLSRIALMCLERSGAVYFGCVQLAAAMSQWAFNLIYSDDFDTVLDKALDLFRAYLRGEVEL